MHIASPKEALLIIKMKQKLSQVLLDLHQLLILHHMSNNIKGGVVK